MITLLGMSFLLLELLNLVDDLIGKFDFFQPGNTYYVSIETRQFKGSFRRFTPPTNYPEEF